MNHNILFLGGGNMATAIIEGLLRQGTPASSFHVLEVNETARQRWTDRGIACSSTLPASFVPAVTVLAVKPQQMQEALAPLGLAVFRQGKAGAVHFHLLVRAGEARRA